ncbi:signal peptidase I [Candidatus Poribacteria bacterium]|nr:signal peptidase I [Candidatus Poribacteria bacterium]
MATTTTTTAEDRTRDRIRARRGKGVSHPPPEEDKSPHHESLARRARGWADALFFAFLLAMFIRTYVFELFMIPTGSMTPALIGDDARQISEFDWDNDGQEDIVALPMPAYNNSLQVHLRNADGRFEKELLLVNPRNNVLAAFSNPRHKGKGRRDMIMVNKFSYWFQPPDRGDIVIFKSPDRPPNYRFDPSKPVYIKRCVGLPGEELILRPPIHYTPRRAGDPARISPPDYAGTEYEILSQPILVDGTELTEYPFPRLHHFPRPGMGGPPPPDQDPWRFRIGEDEVVMLGDNQLSSSDSRYWGGVPLSHLRGRAVFRYLPLRVFGFLTDDR